MFPVRFPNSRLLQLSAFLGSAGNSAVHVAVPWLVLDITGSSAQAGVVLGLSGLSVIFTAPIIGGVISVLGPRRVSVWADLISASSVLLFPLANNTFGLNLATLLIIAIYGAMFDPAGNTARKTLIPRIVADEKISLTKFNGTFEASAVVGTIIGFTIGAFLIGAVGVDVTFILLSAIFVASSVTVLVIRLTATSVHNEKTFSVENVLDETRTGMKVLWSDKPLLSLVGLYTMLSALYMPVESIILARHFKNIDQPYALGMILSAMSLGTVIGALQFHRVIARLKPPVLVMSSMTGIGLVVCAMAWLPPAVFFVLLGLILGLSYGPVSPLSNYLVQRRVPSHLHGPVFGTMFSSTHLAIPIGSLFLGLIIESVSIPITLLVIGSLFIGVTLIVGIRGPMKNLTIDSGTNGPSVTDND